MPDASQLQHEPTCSYYGLTFKPGSANRICPCPGRDVPVVTPEEYDEALKRVRAWVDGNVMDWNDPVLHPDMVDDLRMVVGLPPENRDD